MSDLDETPVIASRYSNKHQVSKTTKGAFEPLLVSGTGGGGDVWICMSTSDASNTIDDQGALYAVKVPREGKGRMLAEESFVLQIIATIPGPTSRCLQQYVSHDQTGDPEREPTWLATQAVMGCNFAQLLKAAGGELPKPLILIMALQLCEALKALLVLSPPLFHGDVYSGNVMIDFEKRDNRGAPIVVVVDFGNAGPLEKPEDRDRDLRGFYMVIHQLAKPGGGSEIGQDPTWDEYYDFVRKADSVKFNKPSFEDFRARFEEYITKRWDRMLNGDIEEIEYILAEASKIPRKARVLSKEASV